MGIVYLVIGFGLGVIGDELRGYIVFWFESLFDGFVEEFRFGIRGKGRY